MGGMALFPPLDASPDEVRAALAPLRNDFTIALHAADNAFAVGAIIRVAHSFLAREIVLIGDAPYYEKASMGMEKYESLVRASGDDAFLEQIGRRPLWAVEKDHATLDVNRIERFPPDVVLLFGSERFGVPKTLIARADAVIGIPIYGVNHSLPLAVAAGIVMNEYARRRYGSGTLLGARTR
jgi:tRNA G18 (ribose-2'-O)-methylase SpoU